MTSSAARAAAVARERGAHEPSTRVVVFDFDGTLVRGDSLTGFLAARCAERWYRCVLPVCLGPVAIFLWLTGFRTAAVSLAVWSATFGARTRPLAQAMLRYGAEVLPPRAHTSTFLELKACLEREELVVIATGAHPALVRAFLRAQGLDGAKIAGSRTRRRWGGLVAWTHCIGRRKTRELARRFGLERWDHVFTDSALDLPIMQCARSVTLVKPSTRTEERVRRTLGDQVRVSVISS